MKQKLFAFFAIAAHLRVPEGKSAFIATFEMTKVK